MSGWALVETSKNKIVVRESNQLKLSEAFDFPFGEASCPLPRVRGSQHLVAQVLPQQVQSRAAIPAVYRGVVARPTS